MLIRNITGKDIEAVRVLWNTTLPEHMMDHRAFVKNVLLDMNLDTNGFFVAEEGSSIIGFVWAIVRGYPVDVGAPAEDDFGYINVIAVDESAGEEVARALVSAAEEYIFSKGKTRISVSGYTPNYVYPGINTRYPFYLRVFEQMGYTERGRHRSIGIDLYKFKRNAEIEELKAKREAEGYSFVALRDEYILSLFDLATPSFRHRYRRLIGETMDYERVRLVIFEGEVIGCAVFGDPYSCSERFGPYMISEKHRGLGLGKILLYETLLAMKRSGVRHAWAQSTPSSGPAAHIYDSFGFVATDEFIVYKKQKTT